MKKVQQHFLLALLIGGLVFMAACDSDTGGGDGPTDPTFDRAAMLNNIANRFIVPYYEALQNDVNELNDAATAFASNPDAFNLTDVQRKLKDARLSWQRVSLYQFGPAENNGLRGALNTYPTDTDQINDNISNGGYILGTIENIDAGGFPALDFLMHGTGNTEAELLQYFTDATQGTARLAYVADNAAFIKGLVDATASGWAASGGNYIATFADESNAGTDVGSSLSLLINAATLHYERFLRDGKIGIPAGVRSAGVPRPTATEAFYGGYSRELALVNFRAMQDLFTTAQATTESTILVDYIFFLEREDLVNQLNAQFTEVSTALLAVSDPLADDINNDLDPVLAVFTEMQDVVVLIKVDLTSAMGITITFQDNDGD